MVNVKFPLLLIECHTMELYGQVGAQLCALSSALNDSD